MKRTSQAIIFSAIAVALHFMLVSSTALAQIAPLPVFDSARTKAHLDTIEETAKQIRKIHELIEEHKKVIAALKSNSERSESFIFSSIPIISRFFKERGDKISQSMSRYLEDIDTIKSSIDIECMKTDSCTSATLRAVRVAVQNTRQRRMDSASEDFMSAEAFHDEIENDVRNLESMEAANRKVTGEMSALDVSNQQAAEEAAQLAKLRAAMVREQEARAMELEAEAQMRSRSQMRLNRFKGRAVPKAK